MKNIVRLRCEYIQCLYRAKYNFPEKNRASFCERHKKQNMINLKEIRQFKNTPEIKKYINYDNWKEPKINF